MTRDYLFPELADALLADAELQARSRQDKRRRWRSVRLAGVSLASLFAFSAVAYASHDLWRPALGGGGPDAPVATSSPPPASLLAELAVLRREQTERDRGAASEAALRFVTHHGEIRTRYVRRLRDTADGKPVVLIPTVDADGADHLCLWVADAGDSKASRVCSTPVEFAAGRLVLGQPAGNSPGVEAELARRRREAVANGTHQYKVDDLLGTSERGRVIGLAPDVARRASIGTDTLPVEDNAFYGAVTDLTDLRATWITAQP